MRQIDPIATPPPRDDRTLSNWQMGWVLSFAALMGAFALAWQTSPEVLVSRFSTTAANAFMTRDAFFGFALGITILLNVTYLPFGTRRFVRAFLQHLWSGPDKEYWFRPENFDGFVERIARTIAQGGVFTNATIGLVYGVVLAFNHGLVGTSAVNVMVVFVVLASFMSMIPLLRAFQPPSRI